MIIYEYGEPSVCCSWSCGIANEKITKFWAIKLNNGKYESILISDDYNECWMTKCFMDW